MAQTANCLNISQPGVVTFDGTATFYGRTLTPGTGIAITNGDGIAGNPIIALQSVVVSTFSAFLNASVSNVTGDGTNYPIVLNSTSFNVGSNFNTATGKYTAPVTGKYLFTASIPLLNIGAGHDKGRWFIAIENSSAVATQSFEFCQVSPAAVKNVDTNCCFSGSVLVSMSVADRAYISVQVYDSTKTIGIQGSAAVTSSPYACLTGYLVSQQ